MPEPGLLTAYRAVETIAPSSEKLQEKPTT